MGVLFNPRAPSHRERANRVNLLCYHGRQSLITHHHLERQYSQGEDRKVFITPGRPQRRLHQVGKLSALERRASSKLWKRIKQELRGLRVCDFGNSILAIRDWCTEEVFQMPT